MKILDRYIDQLIEQSTPECPVWNIEKIREGSKSTWNYIDGCMIKAIIELFLITRNPVSYTHLDVYKRQTQSCPPFPRLIPG